MSLLRLRVKPFPLDWVLAGLDFLVHLHRYLTSRAVDGMYEILDYDATLELCDVRGETAVFRRHQKIKFLQNHTIAFTDFAWGDGDIFAGYKVSPGIEADRYREGDRWNILISLRETKSRGDVEDFFIERTVKRGFMQDVEERQVEIRHPTRKLKVAIIFPAARPCRRVVLLKRSRHRSEQLGQECFRTLPDGRQQLVWQTKNVRHFEVFTIKWWW